MKALTIMSVLALTISGLTLLADLTTGPAAKIHAGGSVLSDFIGKDPGARVAWKAD